VQCTTATAPIHVCVRTTVKLLRRDTPDFIIAPNLWLIDVSDFSPVDYRILAMLQEWSVNILCDMMISWDNV